MGPYQNLPCEKVNLVFSISVSKNLILMDEQHNFTHTHLAFENAFPEVTK